MTKSFGVWRMVLAAMAAATLSACANFDPDRHPGMARVTGGIIADSQKWLPVSRIAPMYAQYAFLAALTYDDTLYSLNTKDTADVKTCDPATTDCRRLNPQLKQLSTIWGARPLLQGVNECVPGDPLRQRRDFDHGGRKGACGVDDPVRHKVLDGLGIQIWRRVTDPCAELVIAFRGTDFNQTDDWISNFRWVTRVLPVHDQYEQVREHADRMLDEAVRKLGCRPARITAVGHSLGGGLAQHAAYWQQPARGRPPISQVIAFDPSFVTGFYERRLDKRVREAAVRDLKVDRVYEHGEVLAYPRFVVRHMFPSSPCSPQVRSIRVDLLEGGSRSQHSISRLTHRLLHVSPERLPVKPLSSQGILPEPAEANPGSARCPVPPDREGW
jgi:pimeloyl-ACP methyl ester carboxylesterase